MDLITRMARHARWRWLLVGAICIFLGFNAQVFTRALLPLRPPYKAKFPWGMFKDPSIEDRKLVAWGVTQSGEELTIPLDEVFLYRRGSTDLIIPDHSRYLRKDASAYPFQRKQFALFLSDWMKENKGIELDVVKLRQKRVHIDTGHVRWRGLGDFYVTRRSVPTPWTTTRM
jgi:hypothetical protein